MMEAAEHGNAAGREVAGRVLAIVGGQTTFKGAIAIDGGAHDVANAQWTPIPPYPSGETHEYAAAVWNGNEFVLWSGINSGAPTNTGERWKP